MSECTGAAGTPQTSWLMLSQHDLTVFHKASSPFVLRRSVSKHPDKCWRVLRSGDSQGSFGLLSKLWGAFGLIRLLLSSAWISKLLSETGSVLSTERSAAFPQKFWPSPWIIHRPHEPSSLQILTNNLYKSYSICSQIFLTLDLIFLSSHSLKKHTNTSATGGNQICCKTSFFKQGKLIEIQHVI